MDSVDFAAFASSNQLYYGIFAILITLVVVFISTKYILRNLSPNSAQRQQTKVDDVDTNRTEISDTTETIKNVATPTNDVNKVDDAGGKGDFDFDDDDDIDPLQFCEHIQSEVKKARHRVATREIEQNLTTEEKHAEQEIQCKQLEEIFKLMAQQNEAFGVSDVDDIKEQMKLYA